MIFEILALGIGTCEELTKNALYKHDRYAMKYSKILSWNM